MIRGVIPTSNLNVCWKTGFTDHSTTFVFNSYAGEEWVQKGWIRVNIFFTCLTSRCCGWRETLTKASLSPMKSIFGRSCGHWMTIPKFWPKPIPRLFFRYQIFRNRYRDFFSDTKFSETDTETLKKLAKVSKPRSFETEMSISVSNQVFFKHTCTFSGTRGLLRFFLKLTTNSICLWEQKKSMFGKKTFEKVAKYNIRIWTSIFGDVVLKGGSCCD